MRYCRFQTADGPQYGEVERQDGRDFITGLLPPMAEDRNHGLSRRNFEPVDLDDVKLLAPVAPSKIVCVGRNYRDHARELGNEAPSEVLIFLKPSSAIIGPGDAIRIPSISRRVDFEGELGVIISTECRNVGETQQVRGYIRGYVCANDVTARDLQKTDGQWTRAKGFDTFCPLGPIVSDEIDPWEGVELETKVNGVRKQLGNTRDFIFSLDKVMQYISSIMTLYPGDLILTGTPAGVGPLENGDTVQVCISGIGQLN